MGILALSSVAACAATAIAECSMEGWDPPPALTCEMAIGAARAQYATTLGINGLVVQYGDLCPPGARCGPIMGNVAIVLANLEDGSQLYVTVSVGPDGRVLSDPPQPVPRFGP